MRLFVNGGGVSAVHRLWPDGRNDRFFGWLGIPKDGTAPGVIGKDGLPWAVDNGAYKGFDATAFASLLVRLSGRPGCVFVACPDVVGNARATADRFAQWRHVIAELGFPVALVLQNGIEDIGVPWSQLDAIFVGGDDEFKLSNATADIIQTAKEMGKWVHVGRVNSMERIELFFRARVDSVDGSSMSMFPDLVLPRFVGTLRTLETPGLSPKQIEAASADWAKYGYR